MGAIVPEASAANEYWTFCSEVTAIQASTTTFFQQFLSEYFAIIIDAQAYGQTVAENFQSLMQMTVGFYIGGVGAQIVVSITALWVSIIASIYYTFTMMWYSSNYSVSED